MNKTGLSLVEVIIASLILAGTVGALLFVFSTEKGVAARAGRRIQAMDFARQTLEELKNEVDANTWPNSGALKSAVGVAATLPTSELKDKFSGTRSYTVTDIDADGEDGYEDDEYKQVTVTVSWTEPTETE